MTSRTVRSTVLLVLGCAVVAVLIGGLSRTRVETDLHSFLPEGDSSAAQYDDLTRDFGGDPVVVLIESEAGTITRPEWLESLVRLEGALSEQRDVATVYGPGTMLNQVAGRAQDLLAELAGRRDAEIERAKAQARLSGATPAAVQDAGVRARDAFDEHYGPLIVQGLPGGAPTLRNPKFVQSVLFDTTGAPRPQWRFVVPSAGAAAVLVRPRDALGADATAALVDAVRATTARLAPADSDVTVSGTPVIVSSIAERAVDDLPVLGGAAVLLVAVCLALATWVRRSRRLAPLVITLTSMVATVAAFGWLDRPLTIGVVAFGSVLLGLGCYYPSYLIVGARPRTVLVVACATATSLGTMTLSPIPIVQDLGLALALGVAFATLLGLPVRRWLSEHAATTIRPQPVRRSRADVPVLVGAVALAAVGWLQLTDLRVESDVTQFVGGSTAYADATRVADIIGSSGELDIVLHGPDTLTKESLAWMRAAHDLAVTSYGDRMRPIVSAPELLRFLGDDPTQEQVRAAARLLPEYLLKAVVTPDLSSSVLSFGVRIEDLADLRTVRDGLRRELPAPPPGYTAEVTGLPVVAMRGEDLIERDRIPANVFGVLAAALVLGVGLRRRSDAVRAFAAAGIATGLGFLGLSITGTALNPITASLGALTAAVGCEFTVVQAKALRSGRTDLSRAVLLGAATSAVGYAVLVVSGLPAVRQLGILLTGAVVLAFVSSRLVVRATVTPAGSTPTTPTVPTTREMCHV